MKVIKDCITGIDGESFDVGRVLLASGAVTFLALSIYHVWHNKTFDPMGFGAGFGGILAGGGAGIGMKSKTEPKGD